MAYGIRVEYMILKPEELAEGAHLQNFNKFPVRQFDALMQGR